MADATVAAVVSPVPTSAGPQHHRPSSQSATALSPSSLDLASSKADPDSNRQAAARSPHSSSASAQEQVDPSNSSRLDPGPKLPIASDSPLALSLSRKPSPLTHDSSHPPNEMPAAPAATAAAVTTTATAAVADDSNTHAPSPASGSADSHLASASASHSERGPPSLSTGIDNDSVATLKTTPSPTTGRKADLPVSRKPLPSASPESDDWRPLPAGHVEHDEKSSKESERGAERPGAGEEQRDAHDEIIVNASTSVAMTSSSRATPTELEDAVMPDAGEEDDEPVVSHYPKRKRTFVFQDLSEDNLEKAKPGRDGTPLTPDIPEPEAKPVRQTVGNAKGVILGFWRDSPVPDETNKHAVIGFIDVRDRLRTRIQSVDRDGGRIPGQYALPPGPGNCWVTFDKVAYSNHLIGLDSLAIKEYVRVRAGQEERTDDERLENEQTAVDIAWDRAKTTHQINDRAELPVKASQIAYGAVVPEANLAPPRSEPKRRKTSGFFTAVQADDSGYVAGDSPTAHHASLALDPLKGTRPTSIPIGHWKNSMANGKPCSPEQSHAVLGILGMNDMFRVKLLRQTKSGRFFEGNFPIGAGALWIGYEDVQLDDHISHLNRNEVKEYCRVRQSQLDKGETSAEEETNQHIAAREAQSRAAIIYANRPPVPPGPTPRGVSEMVEPSPSTPAEFRQSSRTGLRRESRSSRPEHEVVHTPRRSIHGEEAIERSNALVQHELAKAEAAQSRTSRYAMNRERAAAVAAEETANAAVAATAAASGMSVPPPAPAPAQSRPRFSMSESAQRLNSVWASQEATRLRASGDDDVKMYDGVKFERKAMGPFIGKLTSPGQLITIDGEDFVEYRVLTRPSFY